MHGHGTQPLKLPTRAASILVLAIAVGACTGPVKDTTVAAEPTRKRGAEPVDPAEYRDPVVPPPRPDREGLRAVQAHTVPWADRGPAPTRSAQVNVPPNNEVCGAIQALAPHPTNANILYVGAVNGGVWRTGNALAASPTWTPQTDALPSQSIGALAFDPTDATHQTLVAGLGRWSNFAQRGDDEVGIYRTTNGGTTWTHLGATALLGQKIVAVWPRGATILAASRNGGLWRSTNTGATWTLVSGTGGLPTGGIADMAVHRDQPLRIYISVLRSPRQVLRSDDGGVNWTDISAGIPALTSATGGNVRLAVGPGASGAVFVAVINGGAIAGVARSGNQGASWTGMDVPPVHPGGQGIVNTSIVVDPGNQNLVYIGGDRITVSPFTANIRRGDATAAAGTQFTTIMDANGGNTTPHADSRNMAFDANGNLLQVDDGCVYRRASPTLSTGTWSSVAGNLNVMEVHDLAHDRVSNILVIGTQDNGTHMQQTAANRIWTLINGGDGGDVAIEDTGSNGLRFISSQNLGGFQRRTFNAANTQTASVAIPTGVVTDAQFVTPVEVNIADPSRMLVGGSTQLYESTNANTASPTIAVLGPPGANRNAMAYGAAGNANIAYVGSGAQVFRRAGASFVGTAALPAGAATITDVALDPANPNRVWAVDDNQVFFSSNSGTTWADITGNLPTISSQDFRTIEFINADGATPARVALGTRSGVYVSNSGSATWELFGSLLPDVLVFDLRYVHAQRTLYAGTLGRGVWSLDVRSDVLFSNGFEL
jgi:hypothetical protein